MIARAGAAPVPVRNDGQGVHAPSRMAARIELRLARSSRLCSAAVRLPTSRIGHAFVQNLRRDHYDIATDTPTTHRLRIVFDELALAI